VIPTGKPSFPSRRRRLSLERLELRNLFASDFCNSFNELDINDDGMVVPLDALLIVDELNSRGTRALANGPATPGIYLDSNGDEYVSPMDVLLVVNHLNEFGGDELALAVSLTPDSDPDGNGVVLQSTVTIGGQTTPGGRVRLTGGGEATQIVTADSQGRFRFTLNAPVGDTAVRLTAVDSQHRGTVVEQTIRHGDVILDWNASLLTIIRDWTALSNDPYPNRIVTSPPPMVARNLAMVHAAMFDAVNAIEGTHQSIHANLVAPDGASPVAAAAVAGHRVASRLYKEADELAVFDAALIEALSSVPDGDSETLGVEFGNQVGDAILSWRSTDGAGTRVAYTPGTEPGDWQRTFPDYYPPLLPQWPSVTPFSMTSPDQFRPAAPPSLGTPEYAAAVDEVLRIGGLDSSERTQEQTEIALFWSDGGGTSTPAGHWNQIAADAAALVGSNFAENARLFAMLNVAMADAGIASWDAKYAYDLWRPIDAIRKAVLDDNEATVQDSSWTPLLRTPPFPTYTSGHSTFSGAAEVVLTSLFGSDFHFVSRADGHTGFTQRPLPPERILTREFDSFAEAAEEAGRSRVYGGIHFEFDSSAGLAAGRSIGTQVVANFFRELP
jgi:hypothetical protein